MTRTNPLVFLDMDGTLIRTYNPREISTNLTLLEACRPIVDGLVTIPRPGVQRFLSKLNEIAIVSLFTAANLDYANSVINAVGIRDHFIGIHSSGVETPGSLSGAYGVKNWFLVEDTPPDHKLTRFKLQCLGLTGGKELDPRLWSRHVIMVDPYNPKDRTHPEDEIDLLLKNIKRKLLRTVKAF